MFVVQAYDYLQKDPDMGSKNAAPAYDLLGYDAFLTLFDDAIAASGEGAGAMTIALVDIDWFGKFNDMYGTQSGDVLIDTLGRLLYDSIGKAGSVFRYGGDAFMILYPDTEKEQAFLATEQARARFEDVASIRIGTKEVPVEATISCGVAAFPDDSTKSAEVIRKCSEALYRAKVSGRNKVALAREEKMVTKTTHYTQGQLEGLTRLAKRESMNEAALLREALDDVLRKHNS
jgi:diguanylate cyclase (GGDEF)-like protein